MKFGVNLKGGRKRRRAREIREICKYYRWISTSISVDAKSFVDTLVF